MAKAGAVGRTAALLYNATAGRRAPARLVHTYHGHVLDGYFSTLAARGFTAMERILGRRTDALIAVSPRVREDLLERYRIGTSARFHVVPLGFDLTRLSSLNENDRSAARAALGLDPDARVATMVGRLTPIKRPELFLEAAARVAAADTRPFLVVVVANSRLRCARRSPVAVCPNACSSSDGAGRRRDLRGERWSPSHRAMKARRSRSSRAWRQRCRASRSRSAAYRM
jgi:hypothetical protein